jgi:hypothetical protein
MSEAARKFSPYDDTDLIGRQVREGQHRGVVGGFWEELFVQQSEFLIGRRLFPSDFLIYVGAGSFRAGVKLVPYLEPAHYYVIDIQAPLLQAGYQCEILPLSPGERFPRRNIHVMRDFDVSCFGCTFDMGIAQSVFTHMQAERVLDCLAALGPRLRTGSRFCASLFHCRRGGERRKGVSRHGRCHDAFGARPAPNNESRLDCAGGAPRQLGHEHPRRMVAPARPPRP